MKKNVFVYLLISILLTPIFLRLSWTQPGNSDNASIILEAADVVSRGNLLLHGWTLTNISFYTTDLPFYVLGVLVRGVTPSLIHNVPAVIYSLIVFACLLLINRRYPIKESWTGLLFGLLMLIFLTPFGVTISLFGPIHAATALFILIAYLFLDLSMEANRKALWRILFMGMMVLAVIGDDLAIYAGVLPVIAVSVIEWFRTKYNHHLINTCLAAGAILLGKMVLRLIQQFGGFKVVPIEMKFVSYDNFFKQIGLAVNGILSYYGANFFDQKVDGAIIGIGLRILLTIAIFYMLYRAVKLAASKSLDYLSMVLLVGMAINFAAYLFRELPPDAITARYLLPFFFFFAVLCGRLINQQFTRIKYHFRVAVPIAFIVSFYIFLPQLNVGPADKPQSALAAFLKDKNLTYGYAGFWDAGFTTVESKNDVKIRQVIGSDSKLVPMRWFAKDDWYKQPANFLVLEPTNFNGVSLQTAKNTFGEPTHTYQVNEYTVLVWNNDVSPKMK